MYSDQRNKKSSIRRKLWLVVALAIVVLALAWWRVGPSPTIDIRPALDAVGPSTEVVIEVMEDVRGLVDLHVELAQDNQRWDLERKSFVSPGFWDFWSERTTSDRTVVVVGTRHQEGLSTGEVTLTVTAGRAGTFLRTPDAERVTLTLPVRLTPPELSIETYPQGVRQGGSGAVAFRVGERAVRHGLRIGDRDVEGSPAENGRVAMLFGVPHDLDDAPSDMKLFVEDELGNRAERRFLSAFSTRLKKEDDIQLSDGFLQEVVPEILAQTPTLQAPADGDLLETYLKINRELRAANSEELLTLATADRPKLWQGRFRQLASSRVMAGFAEHRSYFYAGEKVDEQVHLGFDLASRRQAEVAAAGRGVVVLARYFGIYGKTVVLDHGMGLMSLYSHLSSLGVEPGAEVEQGEVIGNTGATGLAGGDHLHYSMLIHGVQVDPLEWWDERWISSHITGVLSPSPAD